MMFGFISAVLVYALITFGGVLRHTWLALEAAWLIGFTILIILKCLKGEPLRLSLIVAFAISAVLSLRTEPNLGLGVLAAAWTYHACRDTSSKVQQFLHVLLFIGIVEAALGTVQYLIAPGWIFGYINETQNTSGTFINRNHFAGLLEMLIPVAFGLAYMSARTFREFAKPYLYLLAGAYMALALMLSLSRMGVFCFLCTFVFCGLLLQMRKRGRVIPVLGLSMLGLIFLGTVWVGIDALAARYSQLLGPDATIREDRLLIFRDTVRMISVNPLGIGSGGFQDRFRPYQTVRLDLVFDHAHNDYLETASEWGIPTAVAFWVFVVSAFVRAVRLFLTICSTRRAGLLLACCGAIFAILIHSAADFNLQIPSNSMLFFVFVGMSLAISPADAKTFA